MVNDRDKTKRQLLEEQAGLRQRVSELEALESEHKRMEEELAKSEVPYRLIAEVSPDAVTNLLDQATMFHRQAGYAFALPILENVLKLTGPGHQKYAEALRLKADVYRAQGQDELAGPIYAAAEAAAAATPPVAPAKPKASQSAIDLADSILEESKEQ